MTRGQIVMASFAGVILVVATVMIAKVEARNAKNRLVVDAGDREARVEIDGAVVGTVPKGGHADFEIKKGKHTIRALHADGTAEEAELDAPPKHYRGVFRLRGAKPIALVSVAYGHCTSYYNGGHRIVWNGKAIDQPGMIDLPSEPAVLQLPNGLSVESLDQAFAETFPLKRSECGYLSTHLCHVGEDGEPACAASHGEHATKPES